jgi:hypothetical protein
MGCLPQDAAAPRLNGGAAVSTSSANSDVAVAPPLLPPLSLSLATDFSSVLNNLPHLSAVIVFGIQQHMGT